MATSGSPISLREVTRESVRAICDLKVAPQQQGFVAPNAVSIAEAHFDHRAWFRAIYADETPVGFVMISIDSEQQEYYLWRFMIDQRYQGLGFGKQALELVMAQVRTLPGARAFYTSVVPGEGTPGPFYQSLGFSYTGQEVDGELVMKRLL
jgi:diamine N-acetyltransferase